MLAKAKRLLRRVRYGPDRIVQLDSDSVLEGIDSIRRGYPRSFIRLTGGSSMMCVPTSMIKPGATVRVIRGGRLVIGPDSYFSPGAMIYCSVGVEIGPD